MKEKSIQTSPFILIRRLAALTSEVAEPGDLTGLVSTFRTLRDNGFRPAQRHGIDPLIKALNTAVNLCEMVSPDRNMVIAILVYELCVAGVMTPAEAGKKWEPDVELLVNGLIKVSTLYGKQSAVKTDNFRHLLMAFAEDIRVIIIMIVDRLTLMRAINHHPDEKLVADTAFEASYLYAPLAHRLGLYKIKGELEDLSLKYTARDTYTRIARGLNETKVARDAYIADFIAPVKEKLDKTGLDYEIKGRTKSIFSIWNKLRKQKVDLSGIYDLFAISTVMGPDNKWVEVQIRTRRMDLVAEKGLAAHWRYKGIKSEGDLDSWMNNVRDILETADGPMELMKNFKMDLYDKEVFVFTPRGDLHRLPLGATVLDFAFAIHTKIGCACVGGKVNGRNRKLTHKLRSGDTVEIITAPGQKPKQDWLSIVVTSKARNKIRQTLNETANRSAEYGRELLQRRCKNRKIELEESVLMRAIKKLGFKTVTDFYKSVADEETDVNDVIATCELIANGDRKNAEEKKSAEEFELADPSERLAESSDDILVIGDNIKGLNYRLSKCCNPIFGDDVFGFVSAEGVVKIHRHDCPNAAHIRERYPYRVIRTRWSGKAGNQFAATIRIVGQDDIGIVTNITSIINKEKDISLRNISIESHDGIFSGFLVLGVNDTQALSGIIKKIKTVKGVKDVQRSN
ncbi:MAG: bifunctional (p)ppGpp synthetase/guanosine-3',5'-bis(diphosphate) 3'-pyrophosphohydrolase [Muribaculaceae bacterium]|nr:bifunctional (p)ppGpp synthetase/guanosine-3',5'-bis(diphosphate) 3'-pyrophosphohydrolase [Muribaculaceae bacterium]